MDGVESAARAGIADVSAHAQATVRPSTITGRTPTLAEKGGARGSPLGKKIRQENLAARSNPLSLGRFLLRRKKLSLQPSPRRMSGAQIKNEMLLKRFHHNHDNNHE
jgi:hypothetical protein